MLKRMLLGVVAAVVASAVVAPAARASTIDLNVAGGVNNVTDATGHLTGSMTTGFVVNIAGAPLNGDMITMFGVGNPDTFSFSANFNTSTNAFLDGTFSLTGNLHDANLAVNPTAVTFGGTLTGLTQNGNALIFSFNTTTPGSPTAADTLLDSNFGPKGIFQLTLGSAPGALGGSFGPITANSAIDITSVPTPNAGVAGLLLLGGMVGVRFLRKPSPIRE